MAKGKKKGRKSGEIIAPISHGVDWLAQMTESAFRDEILKELFVQMKKRNAIGDYLYTHGRNEHGIDWIVVEHGTLSNRFVGIQAKSKPVTRQGDSKSESALAIKSQCESAYDNRFRWNGNDIRIDNVELWMSTHITEDAEGELVAPLAKYKIAVKRPESIFALIEKYCPSTVCKIPALVETSYLQRMANPESLPIRLLGIELNPKKHFLEPRFSKHSELSIGRAFDKRRQHKYTGDEIYLENILQSPSDTIFIGPELSGKTYLLRRISCLIAEQGLLPVHVDASVLALGTYRSVVHYLTSQLLIPAQVMS